MHDEACKFAYFFLITRNLTLGLIWRTQNFTSSNGKRKNNTVCPYICFPIFCWERKAKGSPDKLYLGLQDTQGRQTEPSKRVAANFAALSNLGSKWRIHAISWSVFELLVTNINTFVPVAPKAVVSLEAQNDYEIF